MLADLGAAQAGSKGDNVNVQDIIQKFAAKETEFAKARENYVFTPNGEAGRVGRVRQSHRRRMVFEGRRHLRRPDGKRIEKVRSRRPVPTLKNILLTPEDEQDLRNVQPFVLTTDEIPDYQIDYLGREKIDEIGCYTFSVKPKKMVTGKRYFEGQIWVDDRDLQIVKTYGKGVGVIRKSSDNQFPKFETYREQIDGKYWFPTYTHADDTLHFKSGENQRIRMIVQYTDYKRYEGKSTIQYGEIVDDTSKSRLQTDEIRRRNNAGCYES